MVFKLFIGFCLVISATVTSVRSSPLCKCGFGEETENSVKKYSLTLSKNGKNYDEVIEIDPEKETEIFHVPKTSPEEEAADMVYDFKKNLLMIRMPNANSCFLINSTGNAPKPAELMTLLDSENNNGDPQNEAPQKELKFKKVGSLDDRSELSDEMADLCKKLPIYRVVEADFADGIPDGHGKQLPAKRRKRGTCKYVRVCGCVEGLVACHKITGECFAICTRILCLNKISCG